jgi:hypothetical protein
MPDEAAEANSLLKRAREYHNYVRVVRISTTAWAICSFG